MTQTLRSGRWTAGTVVTSLLLLAGCSSGTGSSSYQEPDCAGVLASALQGVRADDTSGATDSSEFTVTTDITSFQNDANQRAGSGEGRAGLALGTASSPVMYCARPKPNDQSCGPFSTYPMKTSSGATPTAPSRLAISA